MRSEFFVDGSDSRKAWAAGTATCPECRRFGCRGQCGCPCKGCKTTPVEGWSSNNCDVVSDMRERATDEGRAAQRKRYSDALAGRDEAAVSWGECVAQVERVGCPHHILTTARKPEPRFSLDGAKLWWGKHRGSKPALLLSSVTGRGKTVAAAHLAIKFAEQRKWWVGQPSGPMRAPLVWVDADVIARLSLIPDNTEELLERAGGCEFLIVDEVPAQGGKAGLLALGQLIARRIDSGKPMIVTTNADGATLREALGAHVVDRLKNAHLVKDPDAKSMRGGA